MDHISITKLSTIQNQEIHGDLLRPAGMFTKTSKDETLKPEIELPRVPAAPSLLSADLTIIGDLNSSGEVQIDGTFTGDIHVDFLTLGVTANVVGDVFANSVRIHGKITGQINAKSVSLAKSAQVKGDILHEKLAIEDGAYLEGHCRRTGTTTTKKEIDNPISLLVKSTSKSNPETPQTKIRTQLIG